MKIGVIGVGHLGVCLLEGLLRSGFPSDDIVLSPRGRAREAATTHGLPMAADNAGVVESCEIVLLAVRPLAARAAIATLPWRPGQLLMTACAGVPIHSLAAAAPEAQIVRIMPITAARLGASPTLAFPAPPTATALLSRLGPVIELDDEDQFEVATVSAAVYGWAQELIGNGTQWSAAHGLDEATARQLSALTFVAAGRMVAEGDTPLADLMAGLATPGGITEAGLDHLRRARVSEAWDGACDVVLQKLRRGS